MSSSDEPRGREYLEKVRPEAMTHLLAFFKESAKHLEPKTRFLISVVTKTINYSPRGLRQYIKRSLEAGASRDEVIDAMLCAYPCAGLTKVCDAVTVLLDMNLPEAPAAAEWHALEGAAAVGENEVRAFTAGGRKLAVVRFEGRLWALEDTCPHRGGSLSEGGAAGGAVTCPLHGWNFQVKDGAGAGVGRGGAACFEVRERDGRAEVRIPAK